MAIDWGTVAAVIGIIVAIFGMSKYISYIIDKQKDHIDEQFKTMNGRFKDHQNKIDANKTLLEHNQERINQTREEMHRDFVHKQHLDKKMDEQRDILNAMFSRLNAVSKSLNQLIGAHNGKVIDNDVEES